MKAVLTPIAIGFGSFLGCLFMFGALEATVVPSGLIRGGAPLLAFILCIGGLVFLLSIAAQARSQQVGGDERDG